MMQELIQLAQLVSLGFVLLLPLANPLTSMTLLLSLGRRIPYAERQKQITQASLYVFGIMIVTYYAGAVIMRSFGISIPGLRIAGGLIVAFIGFTMLFPTSSVDDIVEADAVSDELKKKTVTNIAFVPLAMPGTAGPGTIALIISAASTVTEKMASQYPHWVLLLAPVLVFALVSLLFWICLRSAQRIVNFIGYGAIEAISRVMGFLLVCMAVQFVINGILEIIHDPNHFIVDHIHDAA